MKKYEILESISKVGVVAVIRGESEEMAIDTVKACLKGGVTAIEITYTVPGATEIIKSLNEKFGEGEMILGAGTVLDSETARAAILAGAKFVVSPCFDEATAKLCNRYSIPYMPGCMTITEIVKASELGCDIIKLFPGSAMGPSFVSAVNGPLPHIQMMPTGGVSIDNVKDWIGAGCVAVGVGGKMTAGAKTGDYDLVSETAKSFVNEVVKARA